MSKLLHFLGLALIGGALLMFIALTEGKGIVVIIGLIACAAIGSLVVRFFNS